MTSPPRSVRVDHAQAVRQVLAHPALSVVPAGTTQPHPLRATMARFSDGTDHARRRMLVQQLLRAAHTSAADAEREATAFLERQGDSVDVMPLAKSVPVRVLARTLGVREPDLDRVVRGIGDLCDAMVPAPGNGTAQPDPGQAAVHLETLLADAGFEGAQNIAAAAGILFQARDATAALIGLAVLAGDNGDSGGRPTAEVLDRVLRENAPVQLTWRFAVEDLELCGERVRLGTAVSVVLPAAESGPPDPPATFGFGPHRCPGAAHALELATGVLAALTSGRWRVVAGQRVRYEPRANLRLPASVLMEQR